MAIIDVNGIPPTLHLLAGLFSPLTVVVYPVLPSQTKEAATSPLTVPKEQSNLLGIEHLP